MFLKRPFGRTAWTLQLIGSDCSVAVGSDCTVAVVSDCAVSVA
jgi:hypothetical protein